MPLLRNVPKPVRLTTPRLRSRWVLPVAVVPPVILLNNSEGGTSGVGITNLNSGGASGDAYSSATATTSCTITFDNAHAAHGGLAVKSLCGATAGEAYVAWILANNYSTIWVRQYVYFTANPGAGTMLHKTASAGSNAGMVAVDTTGHIFLMDQAGTTQGTFTNTIPLNAWFRVETKHVGSATAGSVEAKLFTSMDSVTPLETVNTPTNINTTGPINQVRAGATGTTLANVTYWFDDLGLSSTGYLGPAVTANTSTLSATIGFAGANSRAVAHKSSATLAFVGSLPRRTARVMSAILAFLGSQSGATLMIREEQDAASNTGAVQFTLGAGSTAGDTVLLVCVNDFYALANLLTPTGTAVTSWTLRHSLDGGTNDTHVKVWEGAVTTPGGTVVTAWGTAAPDEERYAAMFVFPHATYDGAASTDADTTATAHVAPSVTPISGAVDDTLVTVWGTDSTGVINYTAIPGSMTGYTEWDVGTFMTCKAASEQLFAGTATGTRTATADTARNWFGVSVLMKRSTGGTLTPVALSAVLTFTGALPRRTSRAFAATLAFVATLGRAVGSRQSARQSFTGASARATGTNLPTARLTFTGAAARQTVRALAATAGFTGTQSRLVGAARAASLAFAGARAVAVTKSQAAATLAFTGATTRTLSRTQAATLAFAGSVAKRTSTARTATLAFVGSVGGAAVHHFTQALSAVLSFVGAQPRSSAKSTGATVGFTGTTFRATARIHAAVLAFAGSLPRRTATGQSATLSFTGTRTVRTARALSAAVSFTGLVSTAAVHFFTQALSATLGFAGALPRVARKATAAVLAFTGTQARGTAKTQASQFAFTGAQARRTSSGQAGAVGFTGSIRRGIAHTFAAALAFTGTLGTAAVHFFAQALSATLAFAGATSRRTGKVQPAALAFTGSQQRRAAPVLSAALSFAASQARRTASRQVAALAFAGATTRRIAKGAFVAALGFAGSLTTRLMRLFAQAFTATVGFVVVMSTFRPPSWKAGMFDSGTAVAGEREGSSAAGSFDAGAAIAGEREPGPGAVGGTDQGGTSISGTG